MKKAAWSLAALAGLSLTLFAGSQAAAQQGASLTDICEGNCVVEKFSACGENKFLEGPNFDKDGVLWMVGLRSGEILKVTPAGECSVTKTGLNFPGGARFDKQGKLIVTTRSALISYDTATHEVTPIKTLYGTQGFRGLNDVVVDKAGGIYFTEPNGSGVLKPIGRIYYLPPDRKAELMLVGDNFAFPNGLVLSPAENVLYVGEYGLNRTTFVPIGPPGVVDPARIPHVFAYMQGGIGPDGMLVDSRGNVYQAHYMAGEVVIHDPTGFVIGIIKLPADAGRGSTNIAFHGGYLYITEALKNEVFRVRVKAVPPG